MKIFAIKEAFTRHRILKGLTQRELAELAGLSHAYISMIERSVKSVGPGAAKRICSILELQLEDVFEIRS